MEELAQRQQYELAFHLLPSFTEDQVNEKRREIEELISKEGGLVSRYGEIKKIRLAYPIKKEQFSNFGFIEFFAPSDTINKINKGLLVNENVLRYLVVRKEEEKVSKPRRMPKLKMAPTPEASRGPESESGEKSKEEETKETEELDKKIEEILEKL